MRALGVFAVALGLAAPALGTGNPVAGKTVFRSKCGSCHTLKPAGTVAKSANPGPVLTNKRETVGRVMKALSGAGSGVMPTFIGVLATKQINDVVAFVVVASKPGAT
ncbi:MAG TPA: cytochrome c [Gaiellaceae bacterium]